MDNAEILKALGELAKRVESLTKGSGIDLLAKSYTAAWAEIDHVAKNANNPHFKNNYADLSAVLDTMRPVFAKHGLALLQAPGNMSADGKRISVPGILMHSSGQHLTFGTELPIGDKATAQAAGSAITYARRYQAAAVAGIAQVDDDGNAASDDRPAKKEKAKEKPDEKKSGGGFADELADIIGRISACTAIGEPGTANVGHLENLKQLVRDTGDNTVAEAYLAKKAALKAGAAK